MKAIPRWARASLIFRSESTAALQLEIEEITKARDRLLQSDKVSKARSASLEKDLAKALASRKSVV